MQKQGKGKLRPVAAGLVLAALCAAPALRGESRIGVSASGHYITYDGRPLLVIGDSGTQCVLQDANLDYRRWVDDCADRSLRAVHVWSFVAPRQKADGSVVENRYGYVYPGLTPWARKPSGPDATDGLEQWDLGTFDEGTDDSHYWPRLRGLCARARDRNMIVGITVFFGWPKWNTASRPDWSYHPLNVVNGGPVNDSGDMVTKAQIIESVDSEVYGEEWSDAWPAARKTQWIWERFANKLIEDTAEFGNVFFVFMDEHSYSEGNCGDHFASFFRSRGAPWADWEARRAGVDFVCSDTLAGADKNAAAVAGFRRRPERPYLFLEGPPYMGDDARKGIWTFAMGGGHFFFHDDERQETPRTGIMGYDPHVAGGDKGMVRRDWLGYASSFFNETIADLDSLQPHNELAPGGCCCLADPGREYALYLGRGFGDVAELDLAAAPGTFRWRFYNPRAGSSGDTFFTRGAEAALFVKPDANDWVLHLLRDEDAGAPAARFAAGPAGAADPFEIAFDAAASSDADGTIESYRWDFGDGGHDTGIAASHSYGRAGEFVAVLTVVDNDDHASTAAKRIEVGPAGGVPVHRIAAVEPGGAEIGGSARLTAVTIEGGSTLPAVAGPSVSRTTGSFNAGRTPGLPGISASQSGRALEGLELGYALLGLSEPGERVEVYFPETIEPDGSPACELAILEWSGSTDSFQVVLLSNDSAQPPLTAATIQVRDSDYASTATSLATASVGVQPVGGVAIDLDALGMPALRVRGVRLPAEDGLGGTTGLDPAVVARLESPGPGFLRGDSNADGKTDLSDAVATLSALFAGGPELACLDAADGNDDGRVDVSDAISLLNWLFLGADPPPAPHEVCGPDPTEDDLDCVSFAPCDAR